MSKTLMRAQEADVCMPSTHIHAPNACIFIAQERTLMCARDVHIFLRRRTCHARRDAGIYHDWVRPVTRNCPVLQPRSLSTIKRARENMRGGQKLYKNDLLLQR